LSHPPGDISIAQVINAIGEGIDVTQCGGNEDCQDGEQCLAHVLWQKLGNEIHGFLEGITLASFLEREKVGAVVRRLQGDITMVAPPLKKTVA
jgi:Rrf2 family iron-sulfur cluster assembly transcriptional regulator